MVRDARAARFWIASLLVGLVGACRGAKPSHERAHEAPLVFIEDDYPRAIAQAKAAGKPLFVDTWADWCHTCMSLKEYVLPAPEIQALASKFVFLSIDSENAKNTEFLERFPNMSLPTLWVIEPASERPLLKWVGAATAPELATLLADAADATKTGAALGEAAAAALRGDQASASGRQEEAMTAYREAIAKAPMDWPRRPRVIEALSLKLLELSRNAECVELAAQEVPRLPKGTPLFNVTVNALGAASELTADAPALAHVPMLVREATRIVTDPSQPVLVDDRSGLFKALVAAWHDSKPSEAKRLARLWANLLEEAASRAETPTSRAVWDPHRLEAYIELGEAEKAIPMLEQSERDLPDDYSPKARLARAYLELGRLELALAAVTRALERVQGPRKLNILMLKADILVAQNDRAGAKSVIGQAMELAEDPHLPVKYRPFRASLATKYRELD